MKTSEGNLLKRSFLPDRMIRRRRNLFLFSILTLASILAAPAPAMFADSGEHWEFWNTDSIEHWVNDYNRLKLEQEFRFRKGVNYYRHTDLSFIYSAANYLDLGGGFRKINALEDDRWLGENRPYAMAALKPRLGKLRLEFRNTLEYRIKEAKEDYARYRLRFAIFSPVLSDGLLLRPYVSDEIFIDLGGPHVREINRHRFAAGVTGRFTQDLDFDFFYARQMNQKDVDIGEIWENANLLGLKLKLQI